MTADQSDAYSPYDRPKDGFEKVSEEDMKLLRKSADTKFKYAVDGEVKAEFPPRAVDPSKRRHRSKHIFREIIKQAVKESVKSPEMPSLSEAALRQAMKDRERRQKIAKKRGIEPGSRRWRALVRDSVRRRKKPV